MNRDEIMKLLPHRDDMLLLDSVEKDGEWAMGEYRIKGNEFFLRGHFPSFPVVPGVILCEILAQTSCVLITDIGNDCIPVYAGLDKVRFKSPVRPEDIFKTRCRIVRRMGSFYFAEGEGCVDGKVAVTASFSFAIAARASLCSKES